MNIIDAFVTDEEGNVTIFSVFMVVLVLIITGASVDIMRFEATRTKMQSSMDRAVLAAADLDQKQDPVFVVNDYMNKTGLEGVVANVTVEEAANSRTVTASGTGVLNTIFLHMSGFDTLTAPAISAAEEKISNVEISMVLDISGSMRWNDRMTKMKPAAQAFVNKVMSDDTNGVTTLSVVPYAGHVNPGSILFDYFRGKRPKIKHENNGWGNGDQDAPGNSLCNNNAENADEGAADPSCGGGATATSSGGYFDPWTQAIDDMVFYFDTDGDGIYDIAHMIANFPENAPRDADMFFRGAVAYLFSQDGKLTHADQFLGASVKGGQQKANPTRYFQVKGDQNGAESDLGPTKHKGKLPGSTYSYNQVNFEYWEQFYESPNPPVSETTGEEPVADGADTQQNINMPGSCIEIYDDEFATTEMPKSDDYVPHFMYWEIDRETMDWGWCPSENEAVQYYSSDRQRLVDFIGGMRMHDGTGIQYGLKYGLALLDPNNRDEMGYLIEAGLVDPSFAGRPIDWNDPETEKYVVIMTDGQTTDQFRPTDPRAAINGEVELQKQSSGKSYTMSNTQTNVSDLMQQCNLAKERGVTVFTIAFETSNAAAADMLACASSPSHHFHVQGDEIADAFDAVARQINNLRLIQ
ncbi:Tad domain-containing protein [Tropicibacter oceani]|uniref:Tad domain-containing protein n=1 Tax=Tropicibacter oceani TaxID=3058420 RepID=A0ABY8QGU0_9RHOB|nr:Tad domain-containing protein [Tropicibacter oceani]WGW03845.1 Tad domain-containing protein [Tropicibacter oceani]